MSLISGEIGINLAQLAPPDVVEVLDFEAIRQAIIDDLKERHPEFSAELESDPAVKLLEAVAYRELLLRQRVNDGARAVMLSSAGGSDLDHLAALLDTARQDGESDDRLRMRAQLAHESFTAAGTARAYRWHAFDASPDVADVKARMPRPGTVDLIVLGRAEPEDPDWLRTVRRRVDSDDVRPLTDMLSVRAARVQLYEVRARLWLFQPPDEGVVRQKAEDAVAAYADRVRRIGFSVSRSALFGALHVEGVQRVELDAPAADIVPDADQAPVLSVLDVVMAGRAE